LFFDDIILQGILVFALSLVGMFCHPRWSETTEAIPFTIPAAFM
jgi:hypothetical protein